MYIIKVSTARCLVSTKSPQSAIKYSLCVFLSNAAIWLLQIFLMNFLNRQRVDITLCYHLVIRSLLNFGDLVMLSLISTWFWLVNVGKNKRKRKEIQFYLQKSLRFCWYIQPLWRPPHSDFMTLELHHLTWPDNLLANRSCSYSGNWRACLPFFRGMEQSWMFKSFTRADWAHKSFSKSRLS